MTRKAVFTVRLSQASTQQVQIDYVSVDLTATAPDDYTAQRGTLTFLPGEVEKQITVDVRDERPGGNGKRADCRAYPCWFSRCEGAGAYWRPPPGNDH